MFVYDSGTPFIQIGQETSVDRGAGAEAAVVGEEEALVLDMGDGGTGVGAGIGADVE